MAIADAADPSFVDAGAHDAPAVAIARDLTAAATASTVASLPVFLVAALAVQLQESLHFGDRGQGAIVALYFVSAAVTSIPLGHVAENLGGLRMMRIAAATTGALLLLFSVVVRSFAVMVPLMLLAGASSAAMQPAANLFVARRIPTHRQGMAFGVKQSAVPVATLLAGLAVPAIALTAGWRWAFVAAGGLAIVVGGLLPRPRTTMADRRVRTRPPSLSRAEIGPLVALATAFAFGIAAATAMAGFLSTASVDTGASKAQAGLLVALGGAAAFVARIVAGMRADRRGGRHLPAVAVMLACGAGGYVVLAVAAAAHEPLLLVPGVVLAFAAGWGWNGLFNFAVVRTHADHPAHATGITQAGGRIGGVLGPLAFGFTVHHGSYAVAWVGSAVAAAVSAVAILVARRMLGQPDHCT